MQFTPAIRNQILSILADPRTPTPSGHCCRFIDLGNGWGAKIYGDRDQATEKGKQAYINQMNGHALDIAPAVGDEFTIELRLGAYDGAPIYGYLTETVMVCETSGRYDFLDERELEEKMLENGFDTYDLGLRNMGYRADGTLVCIDWDPASTSGVSCANGNPIRNLANPLYR